MVVVLVAVEARCAEALGRGDDRRTGNRHDAEPLFGKLGHGAVQLQAFDGAIDQIAVFLIALAEGKRPDEAGLIFEGQFQAWVLLHRPCGNGVAR
ncbi:hypothetical protein D3C80_1966630 [compost metagenome]